MGGVADARRLRHSPPQPPGPDPATAARYSAELTAAQTYHETTMRQAGRVLVTDVAGDPTEERLAVVVAAGRRMGAALRVAHAELLLYLEGGPDPAAAFAEMQSARANLGLAWSAANE